MLRSARASPVARRFFAARAQSSLGTGLALLALQLLALDRFGSPTAISAVLLPDLLPAIVLGPLVGPLVDRAGWRRCAAIAEGPRCMGFVVVMIAASLPAMMPGALLVGVGPAVFSPSALAGLTRGWRASIGARRPRRCSARMEPSGAVTHGPCSLTRAPVCARSPPASAEPAWR